MDSKQLNTMLDVIDGRVKKIVNEEKPTFRSIAQITGIDPANPNFPQVKLAGYTSEDDESFSCYNASSSALSVGDWVYLLSNGHDLNTAVIIGERNKNISQEYFVTPQMYGAKADGETDDTEAIQAALDSGMPVFFPQGKYLTKSLHPNPNGLRIKGISKLSLYGQPNVGSIIYFNGSSIEEDNNSLFSFLKNSQELTVTSTDASNKYIALPNSKKLLKLSIGSVQYNIVNYGSEIANQSCSYDEFLQRIKFNNNDTLFVEDATISVEFYSTSGYSCNVEGMRFHNNLYGNPDTNSISARLFMSSFGGTFFNNSVLNFNQVFGATATAHINCNYFGNIREYFGRSMVDTTVSSNYINGTVDTGYAWQGCVVQYQFASSMMQGNYIDYFKCFIPKEQITITTTTNTTVSYQAYTRHYLQYGATITAFNKVKIGYIEYTILPEGSTPVAGVSCVAKTNEPEEIQYATLTFASDDTNFQIGAVVTVSYTYLNNRFLTSSNITGNTFDEMYSVFVNTIITNVTVVGNTFFRINGTKLYNSEEYAHISERTEYAETPWEVCNLQGGNIANFNISENAISRVNTLINTNGAYYLNGLRCSGNKGSYTFLSDIQGYVPYDCQSVTPTTITAPQEAAHSFSIGATSILSLVDVYIDVYSGGQFRYTQSYKTTIGGNPVAGSKCKLDRINGTLTFANDDTLFVTNNKIHFDYYLMEDYIPWVFSPYNGGGDCNSDIYIDLMENRQVTALPTAWVAQGNKLRDTYPMNHLIYSGDLYVNLPTYDELGMISSCEWKKLTGGGASTPMRVRSNDDWITLNVSTE